MNQVEGRALRKKIGYVVCQFILEEVFYRYGCVGHLITSRGETDSEKVKEFFAKYGVRLTLTTTYKPEANEKIERGHSSVRRKSEALARDASVCTMGGSHNA